MRAKCLVRSRALKFLYTYDSAKVIILGIPFEAKHYRDVSGTAKATRAIRRAFENHYGYDLDSKLDVWELEICDLGDVKVAKSYEETKRRVKEVIGEVLSVNPSARFLCLGGDHLITSMTSSALKIKKLVSFDAHLDLMKASPFSLYEHATAMHKIASSGTKVAIYGVREASEIEVKNARKLKVKWSKKLPKKKMRCDYLSIDIDVLDPCYVSSTSPVALGFSLRELLEAIEKVSFRHADVVEFLPNYGEAQVAMLFMKLLIKLATME